MAAHKGPAGLRPRCTRGGSSVAAIPVYHLSSRKCLSSTRHCRTDDFEEVIQEEVF
jgi:hypothetical protein